MVRALSMHAGATAKVPMTAPRAEVYTKGVSRREFLYYIWGASIALLLAETGGALIWFMLPRFREGEFGGVFSLDPATLPAADTAPQLRSDAKLWLSNSDKGLLALSDVCVHLGCLFKWVDVNFRFECPCHGSKYKADGTYIEGPAGRSLDRYVVTVTTPSGSEQTSPDGGPVPVAGATGIKVDTGKKILGKPHS